MTHDSQYFRVLKVRDFTSHARTADKGQDYLERVLLPTVRNGARRLWIDLRGCRISNQFICTAFGLLALDLAEAETEVDIEFQGDLRETSTARHWVQTALKSAFRRPTHREHRLLVEAREKGEVRTRSRRIVRRLMASRWISRDIDTHALIPTSLGELAAQREPAGLFRRIWEMFK